MSESSFPFEGATMTEAPGADVSDEAQGNKTVLLAVGGVVLLLVFAAAAYFLLFSGGDEEAAAAPAPKGVEAVPQQPAAPAAQKPVKKERISAKSFGNDPFKALVVESEGGTGTAAVTNADGTTTPVTGSPTAPVDSGSTPTTGSGTSGNVGTSAPEASQTHSFRVVRVSPSNKFVTVKVDNKMYRNLEAGDVFATYFKVRLIAGKVNSFQFGEEKFNVLGKKRLTIA